MAKARVAFKWNERFIVLAENVKNECFHGKNSIPTSQFRRTMTQSIILEDILLVKSVIRKIK